MLIVTLNRPEAKNAFSPEMLLGMYKAWRLLEEDDELYCAILTANGDTFCAGMDLKAGADGEQRSTEEFMELMAEVPNIHWQALLRDNRPNKPLILAVEGYALAGGTEILQGTDIRVGADNAIFGVTEVARGLYPMSGSTVRLRRQIPYCLAAEMLLCGDHITPAGAGFWLDQQGRTRRDHTGSRQGVCRQNLCQRTAGGQGGYPLIARAPGVHVRGGGYGGLG